MASLRIKYIKGTCKLIFQLALFLFSTNVIAQAEQTGSIRGKVVDAVLATALHPVSIGIYNSGNNKLVNGGLTAEDGSFVIELAQGNYYVLLEFMGYRSYRSPAFTLSKEKPGHNLGTIKLGPDPTTLNEVEIRAEKSYMKLELDKKVFNVGKDLANAGGSASDVLTNIPSVTVDPEGGVKLRGSDNVRILIDGKPSGLVSFKGGSGLQQLQASMIDRVEIITNPSARYEAEGMAGIINIVLKKEKKQGFNGSFDVTAGNPTNLGAGANLNYRHKKLNFFINYAIAYRRQPGVGELYQEVYGPDTTFILQQHNNGRIRGFNNNIQGGLDYYFNEKSVLTASYLFRRSDANRMTDIVYEDYLFNTSNLQSITKRRQDEDEIEPNSEYSLIYKKGFKDPGHELVAEVKYLDNWESSDQLFTQNTFKPSGVEDTAQSLVQRSLNDEFEKQLLFQLDYVKPLGKEGKMEAGLRSSFRDMENDYNVSEQNAAGEFVSIPELDNVFLYDENIHALYGMIGNKHKKISYQAGLRAEWTDVKTTLRKTGQVNPRNYANLFPSAHLTFDLPAENALQVSYSRRLRRPLYNDLSPFVTFSDSRNFFSGNPDLDPEYSNVSEIGHIKYFEKGSMTSAVYYRATKGKIDRIRRVKDDGTSVTRTENLNGEKAFGVEFTAAWAPYTWWKMDLNANFFHADIDGSNILETYRASTNTWLARQTSRFILPKLFDVQLRTNYEAPRKTAQGKVKALYYADLSMSKDVFKGNGTLNLNILDVFNTRRMRAISTGDNFYTDSDFQPRRRQVNLTFNYRINQSKPVKPTKLEATE